MPTVQDIKKVNRELQRLGIGHLKDANLMHNMAFLVRDHDHFRGILMHMPMPDRKEAYECLSPKLRFTAKTLEQYEIESKHLAEKNQLPHYDPATLGAKEWGTRNIASEASPVVAIKPVEAATLSTQLQETAQRAIAQDLREAGATQQLTLFCRRCTFEQSWRVKYRKSAFKLATAEGWIFEQRGSTALCRNCKPKPAVN